jgi:hypothetical protein
VKRWRDGGGFEDDERERRRSEEAARTPLVVQALAPRDRGRRFVLPLAVGLVALLFVLAMIGRYVAYFSSESQAPASPTPVAWLPDTVAPSATAVPGATLAPAITVRADYQSYLIAPGDEIRFTVTLTNTSGHSILLDPCPTYRMYVPGSGAQEPQRPLNCAATEDRLLQGESLSFRMVYTVPLDVGPGEQLLIWDLTGGLRGTGSITLSVGEPASPGPS